VNIQKEKPIEVPNHNPFPKVSPFSLLLMYAGVALTNNPLLPWNQYPKDKIVNRAGESEKYV